MQKIKSIEKGWGEDSTFFSTSEILKNQSSYVQEIKKEKRIISNNPKTENVVYCGYKNKKLIFEMESNSNLTILYYE